MKFVNQSYEILKQEIPVIKLDDYSHSHFIEQYMLNMFNHIEYCGRTCYRSTDKITEDSSKKFVKSLIKSKHLSVLEHGAIYLQVPCDEVENNPVFSDIGCNSYVKVDYNDGVYYYSTNYRVIVENNWEEFLEYLCPPCRFHELRYTVLLHTCIHVYKDLTRHRKMSFSIESTRYCNYSKDKFGKEIKFIKPNWIKDDNDTFTEFCNNSEHAYLTLLNEGWQPQQAAEVLPQCTAADVVMSGFKSDWEFVFRLRSDTAETGKPHPLVEELMTPLKHELYM